MTDPEALTDWLSTNLPQLEGAANEKLFRYMDLLREESARSGVISRNDAARIGMRHIRECLAPELLDLVRNKTVLDIGSGGGLPGIPLALALPGLRVTLLEPRERRAVFLERVLIQLGVQGVRVVEGTIQEAGQEPVTETWELATARGVGWTQKMGRALERVLAPEGLLVRFGSPQSSAPGVRTIPIDATNPRALHVWPREAWSKLSPG